MYDFLFLKNISIKIKSESKNQIIYWKGKY